MQATLQQYSRHQAEECLQSQGWKLTCMCNIGMNVNDVYGQLCTSETGTKQKTVHIQHVVHFIAFDNNKNVTYVCRQLCTSEAGTKRAR